MVDFGGGSDNYTTSLFLSGACVVMGTGDDTVTISSVFAPSVTNTSCYNSFTNPYALVGGTGIDTLTINASVTTGGITTTDVVDSTGDGNDTLTIAAGVTIGGSAPVSGTHTDGSGNVFL